jgi:hypothetical protein
VQIEMNGLCLHGFAGVRSFFTVQLPPLFFNPLATIIHDLPDDRRRAV